MNLQIIKLARTPKKFVCQNCHIFKLLKKLRKKQLIFYLATENFLMLVIETLFCL
jgi:hypothetical protein